MSSINISNYYYRPTQPLVWILHPEDHTSKILAQCLAHRTQKMSATIITQFIHPLVWILHPGVSYKCALLERLGQGFRVNLCEGAGARHGRVRVRTRQPPLPSSSGKASRSLKAEIGPAGLPFLPLIPPNPNHSQVCQYPFQNAAPNFQLL